MAEIMKNFELDLKDNPIIIINMDDNITLNRSSSFNNDVIINKNDDLVSQYIDCCIGSNGSHYDIALVIHETFKDKYRYIGNKVWKYWNENEKEWIIDDKCDKLKNDIKFEICNLFINRSIYWDNKSKDKNITNNISIDHQLRAIRLLQCSYKIKDNKFISHVIKEAKQLFDHNDE